MSTAQSMPIPGTPLDAANLSDWAAIHQLVSTYPHALDCREADLFVALWHPEAVWDFGATHGTHRGIEEIRAFAVDTAWPARDATYHLVTNVAIELIDGDRAVGRSVAYAQTVEHDGKVNFPIMARYADEYVKYEGRWVFKSRVITSDWRALS